MRLVLDTAVLVSASRSRAGASAELVRLALLRRFDLLLSAPLVLEYEAVMKRQEHRVVSKYSMSDVDKLLTRLCEVGVKTPLGNFRRPTLVDAGDEHVMNLAWRGRADLLVTRNLRDFQPAAHALGVHCCHPDEAIRRLEEVRAEHGNSANQ